MSDSAPASAPPAPTDSAGSQAENTSHETGGSLTATSEMVTVDIEVTVKFNLGVAKATLFDLASLQPGYVFSTETPVTNPVSIEVDGAELGRGEIVQVGDCIGIRVQEYTSHG